MQSLITKENILQGYACGIFPMASGKDGKIGWYEADPRTVIPLDHRFHLRRSLRQEIRKTNAEIRINTDFESVIRSCARHDKVPSKQIWLSQEMIRLYLELHKTGFAHSVEVWIQDVLVGGLYGVALQAAFFGESMFSNQSWASQIAIVALVERLRSRGYLLLDAQMKTPVIASFGAIDVSKDEYLLMLEEAMGKSCAFV